MDSKKIMIASPSNKALLGIIAAHHHEPVVTSDQSPEPEPEPAPKVSRQVRRAEERRALKHMSRARANK